MTTPPRPRGRPKDEELERRLLESAIDILVEGGFSGLTIEKIADRAGAPRTTFYRRWSTAKEAVIAALKVVYVEGYPPEPDTGDVVEDLAQLANAMGGLVRDPRYGRVLRFLIAEMAVDPALREPAMEIVRGRRGSAGSILRRGIERGQLPPNADVELMIELVSGGLMFHHFFGETELDADYAARVVSMVIAGGRNVTRTTAEAATPAAQSPSNPS
jgi:AcrR family transcriptional regulator